MAKALKITLVKSVMGATPKQKKTVEAVELADSSATRGAIAKVSHLLDVEEL